MSELLDISNQRYLWPLTAVVGPIPASNQSQEQYFEVKGAPCNWDILAFYSESSKVSGFVGCVPVIQAEIKGGPRVDIMPFVSQCYVPFVGALYRAFGNRVYVQIFPDGVPEYTVNFAAIPLIHRAALQSDSATLLTTDTVPNQIPDFSVAIVNDPPFQTFEILDVDLLVVQTIAFQTQFDFVGLHPQGVWYRNVAAAGDMVTTFKRKAYL